MRSVKMRPDVAAEMRARVEAVVAANKAAGNVEVQISGRGFSVHEDVFNPTIAPSGLVGMGFSSLPWCSEKVVVDLGAGCGAFSILMALNGARRVISTDLMAAPIDNIRANVARYGLERAIEVRQGDGLDSLTNSDLIDVIYCDFPFLDYRKPTTDLEAAYFDMGLNSIRKLIREFSSDRYANSELYICGTPAANAFAEELHAHPKLNCTPSLEISNGWLSLELWKVTHL